MKSLKTIQTLSGIGRVLSKIAFVLSVIGFCGCIVGLIGLAVGEGGSIMIGGVTLHGLISENTELNIKSIAAALSGWIIVCAGQAVTAKFAELYFKNELNAGTPFTFDGAKELMRLGIIVFAVPVGCAIAGSIVEGIVAGIMNVAKAETMDRYFDNAPGIALGIMFIVMSLLCRYGAELAESNKN